MQMPETEIPVLVKSSMLIRDGEESGVDKEMRLSLKKKCRRDSKSRINSSSNNALNER